MDTRILELALEGLQARKTALESEIQSLKAELEDRTIPKTVARAAGKRRPRSAAQRKAHSKRMKVIWAARKAKAAKPRTIHRARIGSRKD